MRDELVGGFRFLLAMLTGSRICQGPFRGLRYLRQSVGSVYNPKLLGSYEIELAEVISEMPRLGLQHGVDIGAAEGYYAVGLARLLGVSITCFERNPNGRSLIEQLAAANGVTERIAILGRCDPGGLQNVIERGKRTLVLCDVEGYEDVLMDPTLVPALLDCWILVEVHEFAARGVGARLASRFSESHVLKRIDERARTPADFPNQTIWSWMVPARLKVRLMQEGRPEQMSWLWLTPR